LQDETRHALPPEQKNFVLPQTADYFRKYLTGTEGLMIGVFAEDKLVGQMVLMGPLSPEEMIAKKAVTRNEMVFHHVEPFDATVAFKSMAVHPDFRGNEISQFLMTAAAETPLAQAVDHLFAQISVENTRSWELFLRNGFGVVGAAVDPFDQKPRFILQKPLHAFTFDRAPAADDVDPKADFAAIIRLTQREELIGRLDELSPTMGPRLAFVAVAENALNLPLAANQGD
jgi:ribosomal protein S18 acetylase RimI-like enzyme